jgi:hypothetical protein
MILGHRYLGITLSVLFVVWFASGIAMIYVRGMPAVTSAERLERLAPLAFDRVLLSPAEAALRSGFDGENDRQRLFMILDRPVYRFAGSEMVTIFADTGERVPPPNHETAVRIAAAFVSQEAGRLTFQGRLTVADQWTLGQRRQLPLQKFTVGDDAGTEVYVSEPLAEVVMKTTRRSRALAWLGPIPRWLYFTPLRRRDEVWRQVVLWTSTFSALLALLGLVIGIRQARAPYAGLLGWHQKIGLVFGVFALTWVFSGWLSMEPAAWASADSTLNGAIARELSGRSLAAVRDPSSLAKLAHLGAPLKEVEWTRILDSSFYIVRGDGISRFVDGDTMEVRREPFATETIIAAVNRAVRGATVTSSSLLTKTDSYYYASNAVTPVLKIVLDDAAGSWVYVDPMTARLVSVVNRRDRLERWLYHGLHSLDFSFWYGARPLWDADVIVLCTGGLSVSVLGLVLGTRRVGRILKSS